MERRQLITDAGGMQHIDPPASPVSDLQPASAGPHRPLHPGDVLTRFRQATALLFRRRLPEGEGFALGAESAMPGLEICDSTWADWEAAVQEEAAR